MSPLWILILATAGAAFFSALHIALVDLARGSLEEIAAIRNRARRTRQVEAILSNISAHARSVAVLRVVFDALVVLAAVAEVAHVRTGEGPALVDAAIALPIAAVVLWVFGVALPMAIAWHVGERLVYAFTPLVRALEWLASPLHPMAAFLDEVVKRLAGIPTNGGNEVLQAEILSVVEEGEREGQIDEAEREMIEAVVEFRNLTAKQVMTPRTEIQAFEATDDLGAVTRIIKDIGHSRIPVYQDSLDNIIGIFYVKDLMRWLAGGTPAGTHAHKTSGGGADATATGAAEAPPRKAGEPFTLRGILRPALFVPETKPVPELLRELLAKKVHIAMVADEFGGTAGLVTIEDLVEEIIGDIRDEYELPDEGKAEVEVKPDERLAEVEARAYIDDVNDALAPLGWSIPEGDDYDTVGGFVITTLGRIPSQGEVFRYDRAVVTVLESSPTRVVKVRLEVKPPDEGAAAAEDGAAAVESGDAGDEANEQVSR